MQTCKAGAFGLETVRGTLGVERIHSDIKGISCTCFD